MNGQTTHTSQPLKFTPIFSLKPLNVLAQKVVLDPANADHLSTIDGEPVLSIGKKPHKAEPSESASCSRGEYDPLTLAEIGRSDEADIFIGAPWISRRHATFRIFLKAQSFTFQDLSTSGMKSRILGVKSKPFKQGKPRRATIKPGFNNIIRIWNGLYEIEDIEIIEFEIIWHVADATATAKALIEEKDLAGLNEAEGQYADTDCEPESEEPGDEKDLQKENFNLSKSTAPEQLSESLSSDTTLVSLTGQYDKVRKDFDMTVKQRDFAIPITVSPRTRSLHASSSCTLVGSMTGSYNNAGKWQAPDNHTGESYRFGNPQLQPDHSMKRKLEDEEGGSADDEHPSETESQVPEAGHRKGRNSFKKLRSTRKQVDQSPKKGGHSEVDAGDA